jgi:hypothetical protein
LNYLARPAVFESESANNAATGGLDPERLRLLGRLILSKRMNKIEGVLPGTCHAVHHHAARLARAFANDCPPNTCSRADNALAFHDFTLANAQTYGAPGYLVDLVRLEHLISQASFRARNGGHRPQAWQDQESWGPFEVRLLPAVQRVVSVYDLRRVLSGEPPAELPANNSLTAMVAVGKTGARLFWLEPDIVALLDDLRSWTLVETDAIPFQRILRNLFDCDLVEGRSCTFAS